MSVIKFPSKSISSSNNRHLGNFMIPLYNDDEISVVLLSVNVFGLLEKSISKDDIKTITVDVVVDCLNKTYQSDLFSVKAKKIAKKILSSISAINTIIDENNNIICQLIPSKIKKLVK